MSNNKNIVVRFMTIADIDRVMEVEREAFTAPWDESIFHYELQNNRFAHYIVMEYNKEIIGHCGMWIMMSDAQITNIAIHPNYQGQGLGEKLLQDVFTYLKNFHVERLSLEVRVSNLSAQRLYEKMGFQKGGIRKSYYEDNFEDAIVMWVNLSE